MSNAGDAEMKSRKAKDIMSTPVVVARKDMRLTEAITLLLRWHISGMPVVDSSGKLVGIVTEHDIMNFGLSGNAADTPVEKAMTKEVTTFAPDSDLETIINCFASKHIRRFPIVEGKKVVGIVSRRDILREMRRMYDGY